MIIQSRDIRGNSLTKFNREIETTREFSISKFANDLLEVKDNLERATKYVKLEDVKKLDNPEEIK
jgi:molecular chaperone GrpE (heat shock protein)